MQRHVSPARIGMTAALFWFAGVTSGCGNGGSLAAPSWEADAGNGAATVPIVAAALEAQASAGPLSPTHLEQ